MRNKIDWNLFFMFIVYAIMLKISIPEIKVIVFIVFLIVFALYVRSTIERDYTVVFFYNEPLGKFYSEIKK